MTRYIAFLSVTIIAALATPAGAGVIGFEQIPGQAPTDLMAITNQFAASQGVTFSLLGGGAPHLAKLGGTATAFSSSYGADTPAPGQSLGNWFLTDDDAIGPGKPGTIVLKFNSPIGSIGGDLIDVDPDEAWVIKALNSTGQIVKTVRVAEAADGFAVPWTLQSASANIASVQIAYDGVKAGKVGFAMDNFTIQPAAGVAVPEPATAGVLLVGTLAMLRRRR